MGATTGEWREYNSCCPYYDDYRRICELADRYPSEDEIKSHCQNFDNPYHHKYCYFYRKYDHPKEAAAPQPESYPDLDPVSYDTSYGTSSDWTPSHKYKRNPILDAVKSLGSSIGSIASYVISGILLIVIIYGITNLLGNAGLVKSNLYCNITVEAGSEIPLDEVTIYFVPQKKKKDVVTAQLDENGYCSLKIASGDYDIYFAYNGVQFHYLSGKLSAFSDLELALPLSDGLFLYGAIVRLSDGSEPIVADQIQVLSKGTTSTFYPSADGAYYLPLQYNESDPSFTIQVEGYQPVDVTLDLENHPLSEVNVLLAEEN